MEIMTPDEERQGIPQNIDIELARDVPSEAGLEWRQDGVRAEIVMIDLSGRRKSTVEIVRDFLARHDSDRRRELAI